MPIRLRLESKWRFEDEKTRDFALMMMLVLSCFGDGYADTDNLTASAADKETIIHVPYIKEQGYEDEPCLELDDISRGIAVAIETVASTLGNE